MDATIRIGRPWRGALARVRRGIVVALLAVAGPGGAATAHAGAPDMAVTVHHESGAYHVNGVFTVEVPRRVAWDVLTDYEGIGGFVGSVRRSVIERDSSGAMLLHQEAMAGVFPVRRRMHVTLRLDELEGERIQFQDVLLRDFHRYEGEWSLLVDGPETQVHYTLQAVPRTAMPQVLGRSMLNGIAKDLLTRVRSEILRRGLSARVPEEPRGR